MNEIFQYQAFIEAQRELMALLNNAGFFEPKRRNIKLSAGILLTLSLAACGILPQENNVNATILPTENPSTLSTPESTATAETGEQIEEPEILIVDEDPSQRTSKTPEIHFIHSSDGDVLIQTSNFEGTCKVVYLFVGEMLTDEIKDGRGLNEQDCQVNRNPETAMRLVPKEFEVDNFRGEGGKVSALYFLVRTVGGWENAKVREITTEVLGHRANNLHDMMVSASEGPHHIHQGVNSWAETAVATPQN